MFQFLGSPFIIPLMITLFLLLLLVFFLTMSPKENGINPTNHDTSMKVDKENSSECTMLGFLEKLPKGDPIPKECLNCQKLVECAMAKRAFNWYLGKDSAQNSENGRNNRAELWKQLQE
jgi:hypothetical protein